MFCHSEVTRAGGLLGYRALHRKIRNKHGLRVKRQDVYMAMNITCPENLEELRLTGKRKRFHKRVFKSKGPNWMWSIDGHDKLSGRNKAEFPLGIHGCIDSFSRKILWLKVWPTNCNPVFLSKLFYDAIIEHGHFPALVRSDRGGENVIVAAMQNFLNDSPSDTPAHIFGSSITNQVEQVIEQLWRGLRERQGEFFKTLIHKLVQDRYYDENNLVCRVVFAFVFIPLIQKELDSFKDDWNTHRIRKQNIYRPCGVPNILYTFPNEHGGEQCGKIPDLARMQILREEVKVLDQFRFIGTRQDDLMVSILNAKGISNSTFQNAILCYTVLLNELRNTGLDFEFS